MVEGRFLAQALDVGLEGGDAGDKGEVLLFEGLDPGGGKGEGVEGGLELGELGLFEGEEGGEGVVLFEGCFGGEGGLPEEEGLLF